MAAKLFAAIDVGSYELAMKVFELSAKKGIREIDYIRYRLDLGTDTFATGKVSLEKMDELCKVLKQFAGIMESYRVENYVAYGTSAIRETENTIILLDQIRQRTTIQISVLSNSEQRFLDYKSIGLREEAFNQILERSTAIVDIGGGSIQLSLFEKDKLVATQNMRLGVLRLHDSVKKLELRRTQYQDIICELLDSQLGVFKKLYLKDREIENIIVVDDYVSVLLHKKKLSALPFDYAKSEDFLAYVNGLWQYPGKALAQELDIPEENVPYMCISSIIVKRIVEMLKADTIWAPGVTLCDGIAYEYAQKKKIISPAHDFEQDIIACADNISQRYRGSRKRGETLEKICLTIFDSVREESGLSDRDRVLLQIAARLHDCGKYISLANLDVCSYNIIMSTEIIGLSHAEREIIANVVKFNHSEFVYYETLSHESAIDHTNYLRMAKLSAILRVANGLDRSHKQKFKDVTITRKGNHLLLIVDTDKDITLEKGLFVNRADFFEEVFSIRPVIKRKK